MKHIFSENFHHYHSTSFFSSPLFPFLSMCLLIEYNLSHFDRMLFNSFPFLRLCHVYFQFTSVVLTLLTQKKRYCLCAMRECICGILSIQHYNYWEAKFESKAEMRTAEQLNMAIVWALTMFLLLLWVFLCLHYFHVKVFGLTYLEKCVHINGMEWNGIIYKIESITRFIRIVH